MKTILVVLEKSDENYSAYIPEFEGCIATGESLDQVKQRIEEAVEFHIAGMKEEGLDIPDVFQNEYKFSYKIDIESLFHWFSGVYQIWHFKLLNDQSCSQYANGIKTSS